MELMDKLERHINSFLGNFSSDHFFVACSGGVDSMVLLHILHKQKRHVSAVHVNYLLRGEDSESDQKIIESVCLENNIPFFVKRIDLNKILSEKGGNLQDEARKVRYSYFETFKLLDSSKIILGQHADDQVETFFLNLVRKAGIMGLSCMLDENENYLRPMLPFSKEEIIEYALSNDVKWREDKSNASNKYSRNKLRNTILPELKKAIPSLQESILLLTNVFQQKQKDLEFSVKPISEQLERTGSLSINSFDSLDEFELIELLRQQSIPLGVYAELLKLRSSEKGKRIDLVHEKYKCIVREEDYFHFTEKKLFDPLPILQLENVKKLPTIFTKDAIYLDSEKIKGKLTVRTWEVGDRMRPIGINGSKLISDILSDAKVPNYSRASQLVVHDDEKIVWCVGFSVGKEAMASIDSEIIKVALL
jgi:tRNA(Ile)-lysidine synthase